MSESLVWIAIWASSYLLAARTVELRERLNRLEAELQKLKEDRKGKE